MTTQTMWNLFVENAIEKGRENVEPVILLGNTERNHADMEEGHNALAKSAEELQTMRPASDTKPELGPKLVHPEGWKSDGALAGGERDAI